VPGVSLAVLCVAAGRATVSGAATALASALNVPPEVGVIGLYWPAGHHAHAASAAVHVAAAARAP
jgi:hypothetical protein